jgi:hypothetical protein
MVASAALTPNSRSRKYMKDVSVRIEVKKTGQAAAPMRFLLWHERHWMPRMPHLTPKVTVAFTMSSGIRFDELLDWVF